MAKSSVNFQQAKKGGLAHNDRSEDHEPDYLLPPEHRLENEVDRSAIEAEEFINELYGDASEKYQQTFGQKLQSKSFLWEAVINLNKHHTMEDVKKAVKKIEEETGFTAVQIAIHRDEGHINERGVVQYNFHAHVTFFTLDRKTGEQLYRKKLTKRQEKEGRLKPMNRNRLSKLQDIVAESLNMERGQKGSKAQRMGHKQYKQTKQNEEKIKQEAQAKIKDIQEESKRLREKLKAEQATRADYAELEALVKDLKEQARAKDLTIDEMQERIEAFEASKATQDTALEEKTAQIADLEAQNEVLEAKVEELEEDKVGMGDLVTRFHEKSKELETENKELKEEVSKLKAIIETLKAGATKAVDAVKKAVTKPKTDEYDDPNGIFTREEMKDFWHFSNGEKVDEEVFKFKYDNAMQRIENSRAKGVKLKR